MVEAVRDAEKALGKVDYSLAEVKGNNRLHGRLLSVVQDIKIGEVFSEKMLEHKTWLWIGSKALNRFYCINQLR